MALANDDDVIKTFPSDRADADQLAWRLVPAAGLGQLTGKPFHIGMGSHAQPQKLAA